MFQSSALLHQSHRLPTLYRSICRGLRTGAAVSQQVKPATVLQIGDPHLRRLATPVEDISDADFQRRLDILHATLAHFRMTKGFGRAIAAPQVGFSERVIAVNLGNDRSSPLAKACPSPFSVINPQVIKVTDETITMWDDCMSFPNLLVKVERWKHIGLHFIDQHGQSHTVEKLDVATSELLQHEIDHLDGILSTDRAMDAKSVKTRAKFDANKEKYLAEVAYSIQPTL